MARRTAACSRPASRPGFSPVSRNVSYRPGQAASWWTLAVTSHAPLRRATPAAPGEISRAVTATRVLAARARSSPERRPGQVAAGPLLGHRGPEQRDYLGPARSRTLPPEICWTPAMIPPPCWLPSARAIRIRQVPSCITRVVITTLYIVELSVASWQAPGPRSRAGPARLRPGSAAARPRGSIISAGRDGHAAASAVLVARLSSDTNPARNASWSSV